MEAPAEEPLSPLGGGGDRHLHGQLRRGSSAIGLGHRQPSFTIGGGPGSGGGSGSQTPQDPRLTVQLSAFGGAPSGARNDRGISPSAQSFRAALDANISASMRGGFGAHAGAHGGGSAARGIPLATRGQDTTAGAKVGAGPVNLFDGGFLGAP